MIGRRYYINVICNIWKCLLYQKLAPNCFSFLFNIIDIFKPFALSIRTNYVKLGQKYVLTLFLFYHIPPSTIDHDHEEIGMIIEMRMSMRLNLPLFGIKFCSLDIRISSFRSSFIPPNYTHSKWWVLFLSTYSLLSFFVQFLFYILVKLIK